MVSLLKLEAKELKCLYTRHLLLQELVPTEVSLLILCVGFRYNKHRALESYHKVLETVSPFMTETRLMLEALEHRHIDGVVLCMLANCYMSIEGKSAATTRQCLYWEAYTLLSIEEEARLSSIQLFYKAQCVRNMPFGQAGEMVKKALSLYKLAVTRTTEIYRPAYSTLAFTLLSHPKPRMTHFKLVVYSYKRGCELGCPLSLFGYSIMMADLGDIPRARSLLEQAASSGHRIAISKLSILFKPVINSH